MKRGAFKSKPRPPAPNPRAGEFDHYTPRPQALRISDGKARAVVAVPKRVMVRSPALVIAYRLLPCQYEIAGTLCLKSDTCCNHSNWAIHGKAGARKADDNRGASGCPWCHRELDQGKNLTEAERQQWWWGAHVRSVRGLLALGAWPAAVPVPEIDTYPFPSAHTRELLECTA